MFDKIVSITSSTNNPIHDLLINRTCFPAFFKPGEIGWFMVFGHDSCTEMWPDDIHTSVVKEVNFNDSDLVVVTNNSTYTFREINE